MTTPKLLGERIANEILMHFRSGRKRAQDVSLSECIESGDQGGALSLMDVIREDDDMLERLMLRENAKKVRKAVEQCLTEQENQVISMRYGLAGGVPLRQREVADKIGISRSYVSRIEKRALEKLRERLDDGKKW